jgi:hypothetical protein
MEAIKMDNEHIDIPVTGGNLRRGHFYIPRTSAITPADTWGGRNKSEAAQSVTVQFEGTNEWVSTDIDGTKRIFRYARGETMRFFKHHGIAEGETIRLVRVAERSFHVRYEAASSLLSISIEESLGPVERRLVTASRLVRDSAIALEVKSLYGYRCQVCGESVQTFADPYAEAAHIRPLGAPHHGPDIQSNLLCLCPNHHVMFDNGGFVINDDLSFGGIKGRLQVSPTHLIDPANLEYHRRFWDTITLS